MCNDLPQRDNIHYSDKERTGKASPGLLVELVYLVGADLERDFSFVVSLWGQA